MVVCEALNQAYPLTIAQLSEIENNSRQVTTLPRFMCQLPTAVDSGITGKIRWNSRLGDVFGLKLFSNTLTEPKITEIR